MMMLPYVSFVHEFTIILVFVKILLHASKYIYKSHNPDVEGEKPLISQMILINTQ